MEVSLYPAQTVTNLPPMQCIPLLWQKFIKKVDLSIIFLVCKVK